MKAIKLTLSLLALAGASSLLFAGPGPQFWIKPAAPKTAATAPAAKPAAPAPAKVAATQPAPCACAASCAMHR